MQDQLVESEAAASFLKAMSWWSHDLSEKRPAVWIMSNFYWFKPFQREGKVWQRIIQKIVRASIQVTILAISTTHFLDPDTTSFPSKNTWALISWAWILSGSRSARSTKRPAVILKRSLYATEHSQDRPQKTLKQPLHKMKNSKFLAVYKVTTVSSIMWAGCH